MIGIFCIFSLLILLLAPAPAAAEYYNYMDQKGTMVFTDDLTRIPENDRPRVEIIKDRSGMSNAASRPVIEMREEEELNRWLKRYFEENYGSNESLPRETDMELVF